MPKVLLLQHADWELPGTFADVLAEWGAHTRVVRPDLGEPLPDPRDFDAVLAMGGPMSVNDDAQLPWLLSEKELVVATVAADVPYLGVCLGAQLLAAALGAAVYPGPAPEFGMHRVRLTAPAAGDRVFGALPAGFDAFQWHGETFDLPAGAVPLATSERYRHQAFRAGPRAYGVQFHLEVTPDLLDRWFTVPQCVAEVRHQVGPQATERLTDELRTAEAAMRPLARRLFGAWLELVG